MTVQLGDEVKDVVTGFKGIIIVRHIDTEGEDRFTVQPPIGDDGKIPDKHSFDGSSLEVTTPGKVSFDPAKTVDSPFELGDEVKDKFTGFQGTAVCRHIFLNNCSQFSIQPPVKKNKELPDARAFDQDRVVLVKARNKKPKKEERTGGPEKYVPTQKVTAER